jgi:hypothetical protein
MMIFLLELFLRSTAAAQRINLNIFGAIQLWFNMLAMPFEATARILA